MGLTPFKPSHRGYNPQMVREDRSLMDKTKVHYRAYIFLNSVWMTSP